jgi:hypothetical protein
VQEGQSVGQLPILPLKISTFKALQRLKQQFVDGPK